MRGKIYFIGGGPGDPGLMTVKGMEILGRASLVLAPGHFRDSYSECLTGKECLDPFDLHHKELTAKIDSYLDRGETAVFLVPGDLAIFSPVQSLIDYFGPAAEVIPGVSALNAASAVLKKTFDLPGISHSTIATSPKTITGSPDTIGALSKHRSTMVLFMNNKKVEDLVSELEEGYPPDTPVAVIYLISMPGQEVILSTLEKLKAVVDERFADEDEFKLVVVGGVLAASEDPSWWDKRKDNRDARHAEKKRNG